MAKFNVKIDDSLLDESKGIDEDTRVRVLKERWVSDGVWHNVVLEQDNSVTEIISFRDRSRAEGFADKLVKLIYQS